MAAEWAVWAVWISKANRLPSTIGKARQKSGLFSQSRADPRRDQARCRLLVLEAVEEAGSLLAGFKGNARFVARMQNTSLFGDG